MNVLLIYEIHLTVHAIVLLIIKIIKRSFRKFKKIVSKKLYDSQEMALDRQF